MDSKEQEFFAQLLITFRIEGEEHLKSIAKGLLALETKLSPEQAQQHIDTIFREAHSLKGAAAIVNKKDISTICQSMEDMFQKWKQANSLNISSKLFDTLYKTIEQLTHAFVAELPQRTVDEITKQLQEFLSEQPASSPTQQKESLHQQSPKEPPITNPKPPSNSPNNPTIRVSLKKLDSLFQETEELLMLKQTSSDQSKNLKQLLLEINAKEKEFFRFRTDLQLILHSYLNNTEDSLNNKTITTFLDKHQIDLKNNKEKIKKLLKTSEQNAYFVHSLVDTILDDVKKVLMQPLCTLFDLLPLMVRDISAKLGKDVRLELSGGEIEVDRRIIEEIKDPLIHMVRNAVDHGIELPEERRKNNKPSYGKIWITAIEGQGGKVELSIYDDGKGIDIVKLKKVAVEHGLVTPEEIDSLPEQEIYKFAFIPGISTSPIVTDLSGRGIGLNVVAEKIDNLGGQLFIESKLNQGTKFRLLIPMTLATFRGIHISIERQDFMIPTLHVKRILKIQRGNIHSVGNSQTILYEGHHISFTQLADLLGIPKPSGDGQQKETIYGIIVKADEKTIAFGVDLVLRECEVLVKNLGKNCVHINNILGATIMEGGKIIPILHPIDLVRSASNGDRKLAMHSLGLSEDEDIKKVILVVEDSITTRLLLKNILESSGYIVLTAVDGEEAYDSLKKNNIDLLLTDIEMPRMDGFALTAKVRANPPTAELPIIICSSKGSQEDREKGIEMGANGYIDKSSFTQKNLLSMAQKLL